MTDTATTVPPEQRPPRPGASLVNIVLCVLVVAVVVGIPLYLVNHQASKYFVFSPGTAPLVTTDSKCSSNDGNQALPDGTPCVRLSVPKGKAHRVQGRVFMVDVEESQATAVQWAEDKLGLLGSDRQMVPIAAYTGLTPASELGCQDNQEMVSADQAAAFAALYTLGYKVKALPLGAQLDGVIGGTPAWSAGLKCNDLITQVDGKQVKTAAAFVNAMKGFRPGETVSLTDKPANGGAPKVVKATLEAVPAQVRSHVANDAYLGIQTVTRVRLQTPFPVSVNAGDIGGPSAGLAFTLAIIDTMSNGKLTGGHRVAATGTMSFTGNVGDVGGVQEKTVAVQKAGAQVFFVPKVEYGTAMREARKGMTVIPVTTLAQVLEILHKRYGGDISGLVLGKS